MNHRQYCFIKGCLLNKRRTSLQTKTNDTGLKQEGDDIDTTMNKYLYVSYLYFSFIHEMSIYTSKHDKYSIESD